METSFGNPPSFYQLTNGNAHSVGKPMTTGAHSSSNLNGHEMGYIY